MPDLLSTDEIVTYDATLSQDFLTKSSKLMVVCYRREREHAGPGPGQPPRAAKTAHPGGLDPGRAGFIASGKLNVPVLEITQAADVGMGSFYNHFDSKEELFEAAVADVLDNHGALLDQLTE